jgi:aminopeptidase YwaD
MKIPAPSARALAALLLFVPLVSLEPLGFGQDAVGPDVQETRPVQEVGQGADEPVALPLGHNGPGVPDGQSGPARFVPALYAAFEVDAAMEDAAASDQGYRAPGDPHFNRTLERIAERLGAVGFGTQDSLRLEVVETETDDPVWAPLSASLILRASDEATPQVLHAFSRDADVDRVMLPVNAPCADVEGRPVFALSDVVPGTILVTRARLNTSVLRRARKRGAVAVLSSRLFGFTEDPTGRERHLDAILHTKVSADTKFPVAQISPRVHGRIEAAAASGTAFLAFTAEVRFEGNTLRTLVAEIVGAERPQQAVALSAHVGDNTGGAAGMTEAVVQLTRLLSAGDLAWPSRSLCFTWGDEVRQTRVFLDHTKRDVLAGISADMMGQSRAETGAVALLERTPDPGALVTLAPDEHTPWGAGEVLEEDLIPSGLNVLLRTALVDVGRYVGGWTTSENPWEGGSDHDVYLDRRIPGALLWHFTDFTYHTSLDRVDMIDGEELRRSCTAALAAAMTLASPSADDLPRLLAAGELEREMRVRLAADAGLPDLEAQWGTWCDGAAEWLVRTLGDR